MYVSQCLFSDGYVGSYGLASTQKQSFCVGAAVKAPRSYYYGGSCYNLVIACQTMGRNSLSCFSYNGYDSSTAFSGSMGFFFPLVLVVNSFDSEL